MGVDPLSWTAIGAYALIAGSAATTASAMHSANMQKKAARSAANAAAKAASTPVTVSSANKAAETTSTEASAGKATAEKAKKRLTVDDMAQRFTDSGLRKTLN